MNFIQVSPVGAGVRLGRLSTPKGSRALFEELTAFVRSGRTVDELIRLYAEHHIGHGVIGTAADVCGSGSTRGPSTASS